MSDSIVLTKSEYDALQKNAASFAILATSTPNAIIITDKNGDLTFINQAAETLFNITLDGSSIINIGAFCPENLLEQQKAIFKEALVSGTAKTYETQRMDTAGKVFDVEICLNLIVDAAGRHNGWIGIVRDISKRKIQEKLLAENEEKYRTLYINTPIPSLSLDIDGHLVDVNPAFLKLLGYQLSDVVGQDFITFLHPDSQPAFRVNFPKFIKSGYANNIQFKMQHCKGHCIDVLFEGCIGYNHDGTFKQTYCVCHDITEKLRAENVLRQSAIKWRNILTHTPQLGISLNPQGQITFANVSFLSLTGWKSHEVIGQYWFDLFIPKAIRENIRRVFTKMITTGHITDVSAYENEIMTKTGNLITVSWSNLIHKNKDGMIDEIHCLGVDLTERRRAEKKLAEQERVLSDILEVTLAGYWDWNIPENKEYLSPTFKAMFGYEDHELPNTPESWQELIFPEDLPGVLDLFAKHVKSKGAVPFYNEVRYRHKNGSVIWIICAGRVIQWADDGSPVRMAGCHIDITAQKEAEIELKLHQQKITLTNTVAQTFLTAPKGEIYHGVLQAILGPLESEFGYFGYINDEGNLVCPSMTNEIWEKCTIPGKSISFPPHLWGGIWGKSLSKKQTVILNNGLTTPKGHVRLTSAIAVPIIHNNDLIGQFVVANKKNGYCEHDKEMLESVAMQTAPVLAALLDEETQQKKHAALEEQFRQAQKIESVGRLAGGVAHDLNNLLSPILGYAEILQEDFTDGDPRNECVEKITYAGKRAADLVRQLLAFSRKQSFEKKPLNINNLLLHFERLLRRTIRENIEIQMYLDECIPLIDGDTGQLEQVVMNLAVNAQDAMPAGGTLTFKTNAFTSLNQVDAPVYEMEAGHYLLLRISDNGMGMDPEVQQHIFEPFYTTKGLAEGTGLGLSTVYGIIKQHHGHMKVESDVGKGTTFTLYLPISKERSTNETEPKQAEHKNITNKNPCMATILLVEDNQPLRELAQGYLVKHGYKVIESIDGKDALNIAKNYTGEIHLLLTDVIMPGMGGVQLYEKIAPLFPDIKVLYISGYNEEVLLHTSMVSNNTAFLQKPFSVKALRNAVMGLLADKKNIR